MFEIDKSTNFDYIIGGRFGMKWLAKIAGFAFAGLIISGFLNLNTVGKVLFVITSAIVGFWATSDAPSMKGCTNGRLLVRAFLKDKNYYEKPPFFKERELDEFTLEEAMHEDKIFVQNTIELFEDMRIGEKNV